MKKQTLSLLLFLATCVFLTSCSKDDFNYPMETLYGTWDGTAVYVNGHWIDITDSYYKSFQFSITFYSDGEYYGRGFFGNGSGTYKATGNTITTYVNGEIYLTYEIKSLTNNKAELTMFDRSGDSMPIRVSKRN